MRIAIFGDIHGNLEGLEAVLADASTQRCEEYLCTGDIVGYGASPVECLRRVRELNCPVVKGNHDEQAALDGEMLGFSPLAEAALRWTRDQLSDESRAWLGALPFVLPVGDFTLVHATLDFPERWGYVFNQIDAAASFSRQTTNLCFYGHTHAPRMYSEGVGGIRTRPIDTFTIEPKMRHFFNVGSAGQPRDGDWRAAYVIYDTTAGTVELRRVPYDIGGAQAKIRGAGLPPRLADRLELGK